MTPLMCMAVAVFFEARSEVPDGIFAVAEVIENRVESEYYPDTVCAVVNQRSQFSYTHDGKSDDPTKYDSYDDQLGWELSQMVAYEVLYGNHTDFLADTVLHYHTTYVNPSWSNVHIREGSIGTHIFYTDHRYEN